MIEYEETMMNTFRNAEIKKSVESKNVRITRVADLLKAYQESEKVEFGTIQDIVKTLSNKFKELIIDEDEAEVIRKFVKIASESKELELTDRLDLIYKYARLYFKCLDKQFYSEPKTTFNKGAKEESKGNIEYSDSNSKRYLEVTDWLFDSIEKILDQCDNDVTQLNGYKKKLFLLMTSIYIVSLKFPQKYGFLSLDPEKLLNKRKNKVGELENRLQECILAIKYQGNTSCHFDLNLDENPES